MRIHGVNRFSVKVLDFVHASLSGKLAINNHSYAVKSVFVNKLLVNHRQSGHKDIIFKASLETKKGVFIDVGANVGQTMIKILSLDRNRAYLGFEPQADCCFYIDSFIKKMNSDRTLFFRLVSQTKPEFLSCSNATTTAIGLPV